jgi:hypothetical protein
MGAARVFRNVLTCHPAVTEPAWLLKDASAQGQKRQRKIKNESPNFHTQKDIRK